MRTQSIFMLALKYQDLTCRSSIRKTPFLLFMLFYAFSQKSILHLKSIVTQKVHEYQRKYIQNMTSRREIHKMEVLVCAKGTKCSSLSMVIIAVHRWWSLSVALCHRWSLSVTLHSWCMLSVGVSRSLWSVVVVASCSPWPVVVVARSLWSVVGLVALHHWWWLSVTVCRQSVVVGDWHRRRSQWSAVIVIR